MQPDNQNNYWQTETDDDSAKITDTYIPDSDIPDETSPNINSQQSLEPVADEEIVHWSANEYIHNEKNMMWFIIFGLAAASFIAIDLIVLQSYTFSILVLVMTVAVFVLALRPPRMINYTLSGHQGLYIGEKLYHFSEFKAFGVITEDDSNSIILIPVKRFSPGIFVYFSDDVGEEVVDILGARLPMIEPKLDIIDIIVRKLRF